MPIIKREFYLTDERHKHYEQLSLHQKELLWDDYQTQLNKEMDRLQKNRKTSAQSKYGTLVQLVQQPEYVANNLLRVADKLGWSVHRTTRNAICDFLGLPANHIDRGDLAGEKTGFTVFNQINVKMYDVDAVRDHFHGAPVKQRFKPYFEQWCRNHLGE
jgi:hypothetical protein